MQTQTFNISLPQALVKRADALAKQEYRNRSELIREALRIYLEEKSAWEEIFAFGKNQAKKLGIKNEADVNKRVAQYRRSA